MSSRQLVSVIVPVYNTPLGLFERCIDSIVNQTYRDVEAIVINDGSASTLAAEYEIVASRYENVFVFHQENLGVSAARNHAIDLAHGDFVMFADSDDALRPHAVSQSVEALIKTNVDMVIGALVWVKNDEDCYLDDREGDKTHLVLYPEEFDFLRRHYVALNCSELMSINGIGVINRGPYGRLIRKSIICKNPFPDGYPIGEDIIWNLALLDNCNSVCIVNDIWYEYHIYETAALRKYRGNRIELATAYIQELRRRNASFCERNEALFCRLLYSELYRILAYELMSKECKISWKDKIVAIRRIMKQDPWDSLRGGKLRIALNVREYALVQACRIGFWPLLMKAKEDA